MEKRAKDWKQDVIKIYGNLYPTFENNAAVLLVS